MKSLYNRLRTERNILMQAIILLSFIVPTIVMSKKLECGEVKSDRNFIKYIIFFLLPMILLFNILCYSIAYTKLLSTAPNDILPNPKLDTSQMLISDKWGEDSQFTSTESNDTLIESLSKFFELTGVQPYIVFIDSLNGNPIPTDEELNQYARQIYYDNFTDENHMVLVHRTPNNYDHNMRVPQICVYLGTQAQKILVNPLLEYFYNNIIFNISLPKSTIKSSLSKSFNAVSSFISGSKPSFLWPILLVLSLLSLVIIYTFSSIWFDKNVSYKTKSLASHSKT